MGSRSSRSWQHCCRQWCVAARITRHADRGGSAHPAGGGLPPRRGGGALHAQPRVRMSSLPQPPARLGVRAAREAARRHPPLLQVDRLSDTRQEVRQVACNCMLLLLDVVRPDVLMDKLARFWSHKHWKVGAPGTAWSVAAGAAQPLAGGAARGCSCRGAQQPATAVVQPSLPAAAAAAGRQSRCAWACRCATDCSSSWQRAWSARRRRC